MNIYIYINSFILRTNNDKWELNGFDDMESDTIKNFLGKKKRLRWVLQ